MEQEFILLTIFIIAAIFVTPLSLYGIKISKNDEPDYPHNHSYRYICSIIGLVLSISFSILVVLSIINGDFDPENRLQTKTKQVTSVEKSGDEITIYNSDSYKIVIDLKGNTKNLYHNSEKLENVTINGYWDFRDILIKKSKEDDPKFALSPAWSKSIGCLGLFFSVLFAIFLIVTIASGGYDPQNQIETKRQAVTSIEKKDDIMTIHNNDKETVTKYVEWWGI